MRGTLTQVIIDPVMSCGKMTFVLNMVYFQGLCQFIGWGMEITNDIVDVIRENGIEWDIYPLT